MLIRTRDVVLLLVAITVVAPLRAGDGEDDAAVPTALEQLVAGRAALYTGRLRVERVDHDKAEAGQSPTRRSCSVRFADDQRIWLDHGDEDGVVVRDTAGEPAAVRGKIPLYRFDDAGVSYERHDAPLEATSCTKRTTPVTEDIRTLGASAGSPTRDIYASVLRGPGKGQAVASFDEYDDGDLHVVRVRRDTQVVTYWLDPQRDWSPVRIRDESTVYGGWNESRSTLQQVDGVWFPKEVEYYRSGFRDGKEPKRVVRVLEAEFNRAGHPSTLTVADIGLEPGAPVFYKDDDGKRKIGMWDGSGPVTHSEFARRAQAGELKMGEEYLNAIANQQAEATRNIAQITEPAKPENVASYARLGVATLDTLCVQDAPAGHTASMWEAYVRAFIKEYRLNQQQAAKALSILHECQNLATRLVNRRLPAVDALERRVDEAEKAKKPSKDASLELDKAKAALHQGTSDIFENKLKPRLERLPTPEQRQAFEARRSQAARTP